jgi:hypothetical protein
LHFLMQLADCGFLVELILEHEPSV